MTPALPTPLAAAPPGAIVTADPRGDSARFLRLAARLLHARAEPDRVEWCDSDSGTAAAPLFPVLDDRPLTDDERALARRFVDAVGQPGRLAAAHTSPTRWPVLYGLAWRLVVRRERGVLRDAIDPLVREMELLARAVRRDCHKMKAFVRFRRVGAAAPAAAQAPDDVILQASGSSGGAAGGEGVGPAFLHERYVAWHRPEFRIARLVAPFFARRFGVMRWTIFTPRDSIDWDGQTLTFGPGVPSSAVRDHDDLETLWRTYYSNIFNPARIKLDAMVKELPRRHWATLPETRVIDDLLRDAPDRVRRMIACGLQDRGAEPFIPALSPGAPVGSPLSLPVLREAAASCTGCGLGELAGQTVFGEGPATARIMVIGEQPGDEEDRAGRPFVGPAGRLLDRALADAGLDRAAMYVTNAVKHFKFEPRGKRRIHSKPGPAEIRACRPWLEREIAAVNPDFILLLGATAGQSLLGPGHRVGPTRATWLTGPAGVRARLFSTVHPSMILRTPEPDRPAAYDAFVADLRAFASVASPPAAPGGPPRSD